jgi:hypothetical protein
MDMVEMHCPAPGDDLVPCLYCTVCCVLHVVRAVCCATDVA